jgi:hypothetical protein
VHGPQKVTYQDNIDLVAFVIPVFFGLILRQGSRSEHPEIVTWGLTPFPPKIVRNELSTVVHNSVEVVGLGSLLNFYGNNGVIVSYCNDGVTYGAMRFVKAFVLLGSIPQVGYS